MIILITKDALTINSKGLTEVENEILECYDFPNVEVNALRGGYIIKGKKRYLFDTLYELSLKFDIELR